MVICVPGSPIDCAVTIPTASNGSTPVASAARSAPCTTEDACFAVNFFIPRFSIWSAKLLRTSLERVEPSFSAALTKAVKISVEFMPLLNCSIFISGSNCSSSCWTLTLLLAARRLTTVVLVVEAEEERVRFPNF